MTELEQRLAWSEMGSGLFLDCMGRIPDAAFRRETSLPGWTIAHLVAHVGYNATALSRLMSWARTGTESRMYPSADARDAEIEQGSELPPDRLRAMVQESDSVLRAEFAELPDEAWGNEIITAQGVGRKAAEIPWMRAREVWIHAVDLGEADFNDFPSELIDALITDITATRKRRQDAPALLIRPLDRSRTWRVDTPGSDLSEVEGTAIELCRWLTGRGQLTGGPELGRWL